MNYCIKADILSQLQSYDHDSKGEFIDDILWNNWIGIASEWTYGILSGRHNLDVILVDSDIPLIVREMTALMGAINAVSSGAIGGSMKESALKTFHEQKAIIIKNLVSSRLRKPDGSFIPTRNDPRGFKSASTTTNVETVFAIGDRYGVANVYY